MWCLCLALGMGPTGSLGDKEPPEEPHLEEALQYVNAAITTEKPSIAITFDDGPSASWTPVLLEGLRERGIKATFFLIGQNVEKNQDLVRKMSEEGHLIGNHTYHHVEITKIGNAEAYEEIRSTSELIFGITGSYTEYMRPPFGLWQKGMEEKLDTIPVLWTIDPLDWTTENVDEIVNKVVTEVEEGDIILLHDCYKSSVEAAFRIIDVLQAEGYEFVTVDQLILN
ncbi:MAG: polysaccharide deacetylase family protein [Lachnospiraceae bacterium]